MLRTLAALAFATLCACLMFLCAGCGPATPSAADADYFPSLTWIGRWEAPGEPDRPLRVALDRSTEPGGEAFRGAVRGALDRWRDATGRRYTIVPVGPDDGVDQDLRVVRGEIPHYGWTTVQRDSGRDAYYGRLQWAIVRVHSGLDGQQLDAVLRHEIGHALGLGGHSPQRGDVMHEAAPVRARPTPRDIRTYTQVQEYRPEPARHAGVTSPARTSAPAIIDVFCD